MLTQGRFKRPWSLLFVLQCRSVTLFAGTLFIGAGLLFSIQFIAGKMLLPVLGGTPNVWITCMLFFQICLLGGYFYAHIISRTFSIQRQGIIHICLLGLGILFLPIEFRQLNFPAGLPNPGLWLLEILFIRVGVPFTVLAGTAPLLQNWFSEIAHPAAKDPYFLYSASNTGSIVALLAYPTIIEPFLGLSQQSAGWAFVFILLLLASALCARNVAVSAPKTDGSLKTSPSWRKRPTSPSVGNGMRECQNENQEASAPGENSSSNDETPLKKGNYFFWIVASAVPSSLLLGVTLFLTTNIAPVPLLWVIPLAVYLLTFIIAFSQLREKFLNAAENLLPYLFLPFALLYFSMIKQLNWILILLHLCLLFFIGCLCHGRLAQSRPPASNLTAFYLALSFGGVLGALFNSLLAPMFFSRMVEYPLAIVLSSFFLFGDHIHRGNKNPFSWKAVAADFATFAVVLALGLGSYPLLKALPGFENIPGLLVAFIIPAFICFECRGRPTRFGLTLGAVFLVLTFGFFTEIETTVHSERNFFGIKHILVDQAARIRELVHGTTTHGSQSMDPASSGTPLAYYHPSGPAGDIFEEFNSNGKPPKAGIIGMGAGSMAYYARLGQEFIFYEIDADVVRLACNQKYFTFVRDCQGSCDIILGDGRMTLQRALDKSFGVVVLDAFSSDAVPAHLLSREALQLYLRKIHSRGFLAFHISNQFLNLALLLTNLAHEAGLVCYSRFDVGETEDRIPPPGKFDSHYIVMARSIDDLKVISKKKEWKRLKPYPGLKTWTDDFSNLLSLFEWRGLFDS